MAYGARDERPPGPGAPHEPGGILLHNLIERVFGGAARHMVERRAVDEPMPQPIRQLVPRTAPTPTIVEPGVGVGR
jgi:hypothetical protein